jgi:hypothetical protein
MPSCGLSTQTGQSVVHPDVSEYDVIHPGHAGR